jgi:hypothetical protein
MPLDSISQKNKRETVAVTAPHSLYFFYNPRIGPIGLIGPIGPIGPIGLIGLMGLINAKDLAGSEVCAMYTVEVGRVLSFTTAEVT